MTKSDFKAFSSVQSLSRIQLFATSWTAAYQASLSITNSQSLLELESIELVMLSNHLILYRPFSSCLQSSPAPRSFKNKIKCICKYVFCVQSIIFCFFVTLQCKLFEVSNPSIRWPPIRFLSNTLFWYHHNAVCSGSQLWPLQLLTLTTHTWEQGISSLFIPLGRWSAWKK